jgi:3-oxoacyl-[acyl-carrier protein] reductase
MRTGAHYCTVEWRHRQSSADLWALPRFEGGVEGLVQVLANELRGRKITVNAVAPGPVATELFLGGKTKEQIEQFSKAPLLERMGQPEDIANVVSFLAGPDGGWINAQVLRANGG